MTTHSTTLYDEACRLFPGGVNSPVRAWRNVGGQPLFIARAHGASVVDADGQSWDVKRLYVGDGSLVPRTLSVNPSLTIMALADRVADHLDRDPHGYLA